MQASTSMSLRGMGCYLSGTYLEVSVRSVNGKYRVNVGSACIKGPFERILHNVYQTQRVYFECGVDEYGLSVRCAPLDKIRPFFQGIVTSWQQFDECLMRINWASFKPDEDRVCLFVDKRNYTDLWDTVVIDEEELKFIKSLIDYLVYCIDGCFINYLLDHWKSLEPFQGHDRESDFLKWVTKYPAFFNIEQYGIYTAVKWTGCDLLWQGSEEEDDVELE